MRTSLLDYTLDETAELERFVGVPIGEVLSALGQPQSVVTLKAEWWGLSRDLDPDLTVEKARAATGSMTIMDLIQAIGDLSKQVREQDEPDGDEEPG